MRRVLHGVARRPARGKPGPPRWDALRAFLRRRLMEVWAIVLAGLAAALATAVYSYDPRDPSFNAARGDPTRNLLGEPGAWTADWFLQTVGQAIWLVVPALLVWAWRLASHRGVPRPWLRLTTLPILLIFGAMALAEPGPAGGVLPAGPGGALGALFLEGLAAQTDPSLGVGGAGIRILAALLALAALLVAVGLTGGEWRSVGNAAWRLPFGAARLGARLWPARAPRGDAAADKRPRPRKPAARVTAPRVAPAISRSGPRAAAAERQAALDLDGRKTGHVPPATTLLDPPPARRRAAEIDKDALQANARILESVLADFGVKGEIVRVRPGPVVTLYELEPAPGTKSSRVIGLSDDIARSMSARSARIAVVPGRSVIGIELPNLGREMVTLRELLETTGFVQGSGQLTLLLGKDIGGGPVLVDLARMPHLLIAGTTGSGKSVAINTMILSLLFRLSPAQCRLIMIDPKMLELSVYDGIPHLLTPVVTEPGKAVVALRWAVREMENRYRAMSGLGVRNIAGYNARVAEARKTGEPLRRSVETGKDPETGKPIVESQEIDTVPLPFIVVIVDEMADLMLVAGKEIEAAVQRLSQMARAAGIHLVMATQRPSVDVITGTIKANFPTRASFQVTSKIDSRTVLGEVGAEHLLGEGDMLYMAGGGRITRVHGPFVSDEEVERVARFLRDQGAPDYVEEVTEAEEDSASFAGDGGAADALYDRALDLVMREGKASTSFVQRHLQIGYNRAARLIERMEADGVISPANHVGQRQLLTRRRGQEEA